jgi:hypothetical protein
MLPLVLSHAPPILMAEQSRPPPTLIGSGRGQRAGYSGARREAGHSFSTEKIMESSDGGFEGFIARSSSVVTPANDEFFFEDVKAIGLSQ